MKARIGAGLKLSDGLAFKIDDLESDLFCFLLEQVVNLRAERRILPYEAPVGSAVRGLHLPADGRDRLKEMNLGLEHVGRHLAERRDVQNP